MAMSLSLFPFPFLTNLCIIYNPYLFSVIHSISHSISHFNSCLIYLFLFLSLSTLTYFFFFSLSFCNVVYRQKNSLDFLQFCQCTLCLCDLHVILFTLQKYLFSPQGNSLAISGLLAVQ